MGTARAKKVCEECRALAFLIGKLKAENDNLKARLANKNEVLAFYNKLNVHVVKYAGIVYKEVT